MLSSKQRNYFSAHHYLTNPPHGDLQSNVASIARVHFVGDGLHEDIDIQNHHEKEISFSLQLKFESGFADIFEVKTSKVEKKGNFSFEAGEDGKSVACTYPSTQSTPLEIVRG